jgi:excisionase family DNA binding protein
MEGKCINNTNNNNLKTFRWKAERIPMKQVKFKSYEELPLMLSVPEMAAALGISRAGAYELARSEGFPALKIGARIVIPKDKLREWIDRTTGER